MNETTMDRIRREQLEDAIAEAEERERAANRKLEGLQLQERIKAYEETAERLEAVARLDPSYRPPKPAPKLEPTKEDFRKPFDSDFRATPLQKKVWDRVHRMRAERPYLRLAECWEICEREAPADPEVKS